MLKPTEGVTLTLRSSQKAMSLCLWGPRNYWVCEFWVASPYGDPGAIEKEELRMEVREKKGNKLKEIKKQSKKQVL